MVTAVGNFSARHKRAWNRLVEVRAADDSTLIAAYEYDGLNRRIVKEVYDGGSLAEIRSFYYSDRWQVLEERSDTFGGSGSSSSAAGTPGVAAQYVWGVRYVDDLILRDRDATGSGVLNERLYALQDANWNVVALADNDGDVVERFVYDAYGNAIPLNANFTAYSGSDYAWPYLFTGRRLDEETGMMQYRNRYYHTRLGRFVTRDPIGYEFDINLYEYVYDEPLGNIDPRGLFPPIEQLWLEEHYSNKKSSSSKPASQPIITGAGVGSQMVIHGKTAVNIGGTKFFITGTPKAGMHVPKTGTTSVLFIYKPSNPNHVYRLDYHELTPGGPKVWHHNVGKGHVGKILKMQGMNHVPVKAGSVPGRTITVFKWGGRALFVIAAAQAGIEIYHTENKPRTITKVVGGFTGAAIGAKYGAGWGAGLAVVGGQAGPQVAVPEEIATVPFGAAIGGIIGGIAGAVIGEAVTETVYDWIFTPLEKEEWIIACPPPNGEGD